MNKDNETLIKDDSAKIDCLKILEYLDKYAGKEYLRIEKRTKENQKEMEENEEAARTAISELTKMYKICEQQFGLKKSSHNQWLDQTGKKMRDYLWIQLKRPDKIEQPESISIFAEPSDKNGKSRFRFSLEIHNRDAKSIPGEMDRYHRHLELPLNTDKNLVYISDKREIIHETQEEVIKHVQEHKYEKVQISRVLERDKDLTNEKCIKIMIEAVESLMPYYEHIMGKIKKEERLDKMENNKTTKFDKNMILYGPPGTGKTYSTAIYAVAICDEKSLEEVKKEKYAKVMERYKQLIKEGRIEFTTFHQSYGYEEFIEGIKPVMKNEEDEDEVVDNEQKDIKYKIESGIFKRFCENIQEENISEKLDLKKLNPSPTIWKVSLKQTGDNDVRKECMQKGHIRIGYDEYGENIKQEKEFKFGGKNVLNAFISKMQKGDIVLSCYSEFSIDAIGIVTGDYEWHNEYSEYKRLRTVEWIVKGLDYNILDINYKKFTLPTVYRLDRISLLDVLKIIEMNQKGKSTRKENKNYVFIIDEINRGNISKIFGELITLIETSKRIGKEEEMQAQLPYSKSKFGVPDNVYILGTMNTADRSIALMDTALRRRFQFIEMMPDPSVLKDIKVGKIDVAKMLDTINQRIEILYDAEHTIGHASFIGLKDEPNLEKLADIFKKMLIPLLEEYFYEDYEKIQLILGEKIVKKEEIDAEKIFKVSTDGMDIPEEKYTIVEEALNSSESYIEIYE